MSEKITIRKFLDSLNNSFDIKELLFELKSNPLGFQLIYEQLNDNEIPQLNIETNDYIVDSYFKIFTKFDDSYFNKYFFHSLSENKLLKINDLRKEYYKRPDNIKFREYVEDIDNPKNMDKIVDKLLALYSLSEEDFFTYAKENADKIKTIEKIKKSKSKTVISLIYLCETIISSSSMENMFNIMKKLDINILTVCQNTTQQINIKNLNKENFKILEIKAKENNIPLFDFIKTVTSFDTIFKVIKESKIDNDDLLTMWPSMLDSTYETAKDRQRFLRNHCFFNKNIELYDKKENLLYDLLDNKSAREKVLFIYLYEQETRNFLADLKKINLDFTLPKSKNQKSLSFKI